MQATIINEALKDVVATQYDIAIVNQQLNKISTNLALLVDKSKGITSADHEGRLRGLEKHKNMLWGVIGFLGAALPTLITVLLMVL